MVSQLDSIIAVVPAVPVLNSYPTSHPTRRHHVPARSSENSPSLEPLRETGQLLKLRGAKVVPSRKGMTMRTRCGAEYPNLSPKSVEYSSLQAETFRFCSGVKKELRYSGSLLQLDEDGGGNLQCCGSHRKASGQRRIRFS